MKTGSRLPAALGAIQLLSVAIVYLGYLMMAGFHDGFLSERDAAEVKLLTAYNWFSLALALAFFGMARLARSRDMGRPLLVACAIWALAIGVVVACEFWFARHLMDSAGG